MDESQPAGQPPGFLNDIAVRILKPRNRALLRLLATFYYRIPSIDITIPLYYMPLFVPPHLPLEEKLGVRKNIWGFTEFWKQRITSCLHYVP